MCHSDIPSLLNKSLVQAVTGTTAPAKAKAAARKAPAKRTAAKPAAKSSPRKKVNYPCFTLDGDLQLNHFCSRPRGLKWTCFSCYLYPSTIFIISLLYLSRSYNLTASSFLFPSICCGLVYFLYFSLFFAIWYMCKLLPRWCTSVQSLQL